MSSKGLRPVRASHAPIYGMNVSNWKDEKGKNGMVGIGGKAFRRTMFSQSPKRKKVEIYSSQGPVHNIDRSLVFYNTVTRQTNNQQTQ